MVSKSRLIADGLATAVPAPATTPLPLLCHLSQIGYTDETCRTAEVKYWGEDSVSEDFDMYIRLASVGSFGRYVMYTGAEFQEGVSLTYMDEVVKFKKVRF